MRVTDDLTPLEQQAMMAILRLHPNGYAVNIREEIAARTGKTHSYGPLYTLLGRLEDRGIVKPRVGEATAVRGGRRKTYYELTALGRRTLDSSLRQTLQVVQHGLSPIGAET